MGRVQTGGHDPATAVALLARAGDRAAAETFVRLTQGDVWRLCRYLSSPSEAQDLTQETYARAFAGLHRFAGRSTARTWLLAIARHVCADAVARAVRERRAVPGPPAAGPDPADAVEIDLLLASLSDERRQAFVLTQLLGYSYAEAADICHCPVGTIRSRVARGRDDLQAAVAGRDRRRDA